MLVVTEIIPINMFQQRVTVSDASGNFVGELTYGDSVSDDVIRRMAPTLLHKIDKVKRKKKQEEDKCLYNQLFGTD